jgi:hypothetical protein
MKRVGALLSAIILSCLSIPACASDPVGTALPPITGPNMDVPTPLISKPNMDMPAPNPKPLVKLDKNPSQAINQTGNITSNQTQVSEQIDLNGKWSIKFDDGGDRSLNLILLPSGGTRVIGFGDLMKKSIRISVTATGSLAGQQLSLTVKSATSKYINEKYDECILNLLMINDTLSGTYAMKSGGRSLGQGNATAVKQ